MPVPPDDTPVELVLVDFDDTIVNTSPRFSGARRRLFDLLASHGYAAEEAERLHHDVIDPDLRRRFGFGPQRLEHAFRETYDHLRREAGHALDDAVAEACAALGREVAGTPPAFAGAIDALVRLAAALPTVIYTQAGDDAYQRSCLREAGIFDVLPEDRVRIAVEKGRDDFVATLQAYGVADAAGVWMIGNSMRSDINPALAAGANAILVQAEDPWHFDDVEPWADHFLQADTFAQAADMLLTRAARQRSDRS